MRVLARGLLREQALRCSGEPSPHLFNSLLARRVAPIAGSGWSLLSR